MISIPRLAYASLVAWAESLHRKPLLLRGARQVGKTYLARKLGERFPHLIEVNFLAERRIHTLFKGDISVERILESLATIYGKPVVDGQTLLFFDEIQECPEAITALRFFYEKRPMLHVISAGSLLEFALAEIPSFGVGRVESLFLYPVSFDEYLAARTEHTLIDYIQNASPTKNEQVVHEKVLRIFKEFLFHGGLPEVAATFLETRDYQRTAALLDDLRLSLEDDFAKYRKRVPEVRLREVVRSVSLQAGKKFVCSHAYPDAKAGQVQQALNLLVQAGIVHTVYHSASNGLPLGGEINTKKFKAIPFDHGIYQRSIGVTPSELLIKEFDPINKGAMAEVYAGCALFAHFSARSKGELFYWHREQKSSTAEVDYVVQVDEKIVPIEIKSGSKGSMQSMFSFLEEKRRSPHTKIGVRASMENFGEVNNILIIPLYALSQLSRLVSNSQGRAIDAE
jgi:predicted AAA+ superfamily ATPase